MTSILFQHKDVIAWVHMGILRRNRRSIVYYFLMRRRYMNVVRMEIGCDYYLLLMIIKQEVKAWWEQQY